MRAGGLAVIGAVWVVMLTALMARGAEGEIRLIVRADDMGVAHAVNEACIRAHREGIVKSVEVMVPGQWFLEAAKMCNENPGLDVGVHLTLTSEWELCKWRPITGGKSIADADGYFYPMTGQRKDFPPNTGFLDARPKLEEVEAELRAQIELAKKHIRNVTHLSVHMGTATASPELRKLTEKLAAEYGLPLDSKEWRRPGGFSGAKTAEDKEKRMVEILEKLEPGTWLFVEHPGMDVAEMRGMGHKGYENVAEDREGVTRAMTSAKVKEVVQKRGIRVMSYGEAIK